MLFSFILPAYKVRYLNQAIKSIIDQTYQDFELVIVNDASPEDVGGVVEQFTDERISYYKNEVNIGGNDLVGQWNHCIQYAKGDYIILASDDDVYASDYLETFVPLIHQYPQVNVFRPRIQKIDSDGHIIGVDAHLTEYMPEMEYIYYYFRGFLFSGIPQYIFKKSALVELGGFIDLPAAWFSDDLTVLNLINNGIVSSPRILFSFRVSDINISAKKNDWDLLKKKLDASNKYCLLTSELLKKIEAQVSNSSSPEYFYYTASKNGACYKARGIVADILYKEGFVAFIKTFLYLKRKQTAFVSVSWLVKTFCGICFYKLFAK